MTVVITRCGSFPAGLSVSSRKEHRNGKMGGVVNDVNGMFVQTIAPAPTESLHSTEYYSVGFNVYAMATADYRFVRMAMETPWGNKRFRCFSRSQAWNLTKILPPGYFVLGDAAYPLCEQMLTPNPGRDYIYIS